MENLITIRDKLAKFIHDEKICFHGPIKKQSFSELPTYYPINILKSKIEHGKIDIGGITYSTSEGWNQISQDIQCATKINITSMYVLLSSDWNRSVYHLIHEITHTVTLSEQHKTIKNNTFQPFATANGKYTACHHPISFYRNLAILLRISKNLKIWTPSADFLGYKPNDLERFDSFTIG